MESTGEEPSSLWLPYSVKGTSKVADLHVKVGQQVVPLHSQWLSQWEVLCDLFESSPAKGWAAGVQSVFDKIEPEGLKVSWDTFWCIVQG